RAPGPVSVRLRPRAGACDLDGARGPRSVGGRSARRRRGEGAMTETELRELRDLIRTIPDYPKPGIMFRDVTTLLGNARGLERAVHALAARHVSADIDKVAGIE